MIKPRGSVPGATTVSSSDRCHRTVSVRQADYRGNSVYHPRQVAYVVRAVFCAPYPYEQGTSLGVHNLPVERSDAAGVSFLPLFLLAVVPELTLSVVRQPWRTDGSQLCPAMHGSSQPRDSGLLRINR